MRFIKNQYFWLIIILILGFTVKLYKIDAPLADWHSWRQADTAAVARNFFKDGFNPFYPKYDDMSGVAEVGPDGSSPVNVNRYRFVEFPIYNSLVYFAYLLNGAVDIKLARIISILMSTGSTIFVFLIVRRYWGKVNSLLSALIFTTLPFNIYFSRVVLPEPTLVFFCLGMFYLTDLWIWKGGNKLFFASIFFTACAFLIKPVAFFYLLPLTYSYYRKENRLWPIPARYFLFGILSILPFIGWRFWINLHPEGIPAAAWLLNGNGIRLRPAFWKWIIDDRFGREILTVPGTVLFFIGILKKADKNGLLLHCLTLSSFLYLIVFATGNVQHDYYQTLIVPALSIFLARGFYLLIKGIPDFVPRFWTIPFAILFLTLIYYFGWNEAKGLFQINNGVIVEAGEEADKILPKNAVVVAPYNGDTAFLYQTNRFGFAYVVFPIEELINKYGVTDYVSVNFDDKTNWVMRHYKVVEKTPKFVIVDLTQKNLQVSTTTDPEP